MSKETNKLQSLRKKNQRLEKVMAQDSSTVKEHAVILNDYRFFARVVGRLVYSKMASCLKHNLKEVKQDVELYEDRHELDKSIWSKSEYKELMDACKKSSKSLRPLRLSFYEIDKVVKSAHAPNISYTKLIKANEMTNRQLGQLIVDHHLFLKNKKHKKLSAEQVSDDRVYKLQYPKNTDEANHYLSKASKRYFSNREDENQ